MDIENEVVWFSYTDELLETQTALANSMQVLIGRLEDFQSACIRAFHYRPAIQVQKALRVVRWVSKRRSAISALQLIDDQEVTRNARITCAVLLERIQEHMCLVLSGCGGSSCMGVQVSAYQMSQSPPQESRRHSCTPSLLWGHRSTQQIAVYVTQALL